MVLGRWCWKFGPILKLLFWPRSKLQAEQNHRTLYMVVVNVYFRWLDMSPQPWRCNMNIFEYKAQKIRYSNTNTQFSGYEYIRYLYSANLLRTNIFDIHIRSCCEQQIYSIFVFSLVANNEYIWYSCLVRSQNMSNFDIFIRQNLS